jgi:ABC-type sulfate transport system permease component
MTDSPPQSEQPPRLRVRSDVPFYACLGVIGGAYVLLLAAMLVAQATHTSADDILAALRSREIQYSIKLSLLSCAVTTILSLWVAVPVGYLMSRHNFPGKTFVDAMLDIPIVLPPLVVGLCLLILFNSPAANGIEAFLHKAEFWMADNLVPCIWFIGLASFGVVGYAALGRWSMMGPAARGVVVAGAAIAGTLAASWNYVFPRMPEWAPVAPELKTLDVDYRDQSPLVKSRSVYTGRYAFTGTAAEVTRAIETEFRKRDFHDFQILGVPESLAQNGRRRYAVPMTAAQRESSGFDGEVLVSIRPREPLKDLRQRRVDLAGDAIDWIVTCDVQRLESVSVDNFVPKITFQITFAIPAVILAQFLVACAFAVRTMRVTFDQLHPRFEQVALTLGCNRSQAFWLVVLPQCRRGMLAAGTLAWARSLGEFGPILIFAGSTRMKTEVLSTTVFLELTVGSIEGAVAASLIMIVSAVIVLVIARVFGLRRVAF